jgi:N-methylhydantoinase B
VSGRKVKTGDVLRVMGPSGAGYGDPRERVPSRVLADWRDDMIDLATAAEVYGVVIDEATGSIDEIGTARLRQEPSE